MKISKLKASSDNPARWTCWFIIFTWLHMLWLSWQFSSGNIEIAGWNSNTIFHTTAWICYSLLYLLPLMFVIVVYKSSINSLPTLQTIIILAISIALLLIIRIDWMIYELYRFHINRFVLNLLFTKGGLSSLGSSSASYISMLLMVAKLALLQMAFLLCSMWISTNLAAHIPLTRSLLSIFICTFLCQGFIYGTSDLMHYSPVLDGSKSYPLYRRIRFRHLAEQLGFNRTETKQLSLQKADKNLHYPLRPVQFVNPAKTPNIIIVVAESLRWDQLSPETMPNSWQFAESHLNFRKHYSSGNGTREGLFGMFYGLYGSYWEDFLNNATPPLLMSRLQQLHYRFDLRTSAAFTYPEFDRTLFAGIDKKLLHEADDNLSPWQRDENNMDELLKFLDKQTDSQAFMSFFFMESTHAGYYFPAHTAPFADYQQAPDYTRLSRAELSENIAPLLNRYRNASHWADLQLGRLYQKLQENNLLDNTVVIVTGDHGEEFMEKGAWGHNSAFVEEQTHVPLLMHIPGVSAANISDSTSHLDISATLLQLLGAQGDPLDYSLGMNLLQTRDRDYIVISDWHSLGIQTRDLKYRIPYLNSGTDYWAPTDENDKQLTEQSAEQLTDLNQQQLLEAMRNYSLYKE